MQSEMKIYCVIKIYKKYIESSKFPDFPLIFEENAKFPDFSLTGKMPSNFPWFPEAVWALSFVFSGWLSSATTDSSEQLIT